MSTYLEDDAQLIRANLPANVAPPEDSDSLFVFYAVLMRALGERVTPSDVHDAWAAWIISSGKNHAALVPFELLDDQVQNEDFPYVEAIRRAAKKRGTSITSV